MLYCLFSIVLLLLESVASFVLPSPASPALQVDYAHKRVPRVSRSEHQSRSQRSARGADASAEIPGTSNSNFVRRASRLVDGAPIFFRTASAKDLEVVGVSPSSLTRGSLAVAVSGENGNVAVASAEPLNFFGGSSVATWTFGLHLREAVSGSQKLEQLTRSLLFDELISRFLNDGGRIRQLRGRGKDEAMLSRYGFITATHEIDEKHTDLSNESAKEWTLIGDKDSAASAVELALKGEPKDVTLIGVLGRLYHDQGDIQGAVDAYMRAVQLDPARGDIFRSLGGAYQTLGYHQMAFASFQQAISLDVNDFVAYLKLGSLYEQLAHVAGKYEAAGEHAIKCYQHYLDSSGTEDTDVLTRLGNLQVLRLLPQDAVATYKRALAVDPTLAPVWHNLASAHLRLKETSAAAACLKKAFELDPTLPSPRHLIDSLESEGGDVVKEETAEAREARLTHARGLYNFYADNYDDHMRNKLLYTAPRVLRAAVRDAFNATFLADPVGFTSGIDNVPGAEEYKDVLPYLNASLSILDLGCGTGLCGSWFNDYSRETVGVDISQRMIDMATKKGCYTKLVCKDLEAYLDTVSPESMDVVVCGDSLQYIGDCNRVFRGSREALRPGGLLAATVPEADSSAASAGSGLVLQGEGTYAFTIPYMEQAAKNAGLEIVSITHKSSRIERGEPLPGILVLLRKPGKFSIRGGDKESRIGGGESCGSH